MGEVPLWGGGQPEEKQNLSARYGLTTLVLCRKRKRRALAIERREKCFYNRDEDQGEITTTTVGGGGEKKKTKPGKGEKREPEAYPSDRFREMRSNSIADLGYKTNWSPVRRKKVSHYKAQRGADGLRSTTDARTLRSEGPDSHRPTRIKWNQKKASGKELEITACRIGKHV